MDLSQYLPSIIQFGPTVVDPNVPVRPDLFARFSVEINPQLVNTDLGINKFIVLIEEATWISVPLVYSNYESKVLSFAPGIDLTPGGTYLLTVLGTLATPEGRQMGTDRSWAFTVAASNVTIPQPIAPANYTAYAQLPQLSWMAVTTTGSVDYLVELDVTPEFASIETRGWSTTTALTTAAIGIALPAQATYWWRVTARSTDVSGTTYSPPSPIWAFYVGTPAAVSPDSALNPTSVFGNTTTVSGFADGDCNLAAWPNLDVIFSAAVASGSVNSNTVSLRHEAVDGYPGTPPGFVTLTLDLSGSVLHVTPADVILPNTRYTFIVDGVTDLTGLPFSRIEKYFSSHYNPLYCGLLTIRADYGGLIGNVSDDFIYFHIFRTSLDVNRHYIRAYPLGVLSQGPTETTVRNQMFTLTYGMERWCEIETGRRILEAIYREFLSGAGRTQKLGDFEEAVDVNLIAMLQSEIKRLQKEATYWIAEFSRKRARPATAVKSEWYPRYRDNLDYSRIDRARTPF